MGRSMIDQDMKKGRVMSVVLIMLRYIRVFLFLLPKSLVMKEVHLL